MPIWIVKSPRADQSELTRTVYEAEVIAFLKWAGKPAQDVHIGDVVSYKQVLTDKGLAPATIAKKLSALRSFYKVPCPGPHTDQPDGEGEAAGGEG